MINLGDVTKINGADAPVVDVIIGGSPCQDLSVAGKRAGLAGERSGLYMDQIRIIKEMREKDVRSGRTGEFIRPRYMVWENVPGAFSSNKGKDFAAVLEEAIRVSEPEAPDLPVPEKGWPKAGMVVGDGWSIAWRVLDAQFWGVPQRRRRIALVADFGGQSAPEILFIRKGVSGDSEPSKPKRKEAAGDVGTGADGAITFEPGIASRLGSHVYSGVSGTLRANAGDNQISVVAGFNYLQGAKAKGIAYEEEMAPTLRADQRGEAVCYNGSNITSPLNKTDPKPGDPCHTLTDDSRNYVVSIENHPADSRVQIDDSGTCQTLTSRMGTGGGQCPTRWNNGGQE